MARRSRADIAAEGRFAAWRNDWCLFAREAFDVTLDPEQEAILRSVQTNPRTSVASGTARGKDFVAAVAALCFLYLTPKWRGDALVENTKVALTAPTDRQVKNIMMPEISRLYSRAEARGFALPGGRLNAYDVRTCSSEWFLTGFKADEHNHEAWSGFHAVNTMFVVTEASGISEDIFAAIEGNLQGNSRILLVFNPNVPTGYAARSQKGDRWARFRLSSLTAPNVVQRRTVIPGQVDYGWVLDKIANWCAPISSGEVSPEMDDFEFEGRWYRPEDLFRAKVLGKFPKVGEDSLIPQQWLDMAHSRWEAAGGVDPESAEPRMLGVDVAGMGRDCSCLVERHGDWVDRIFTYNSGGGADHMRIAGMVHERRKGRRRDMRVSVDTIGEGAGVYSRLLETDDPRMIISCKYSEAARRGDRPLTDATGQYQFLNMRAWLFWAMRDWLNPKNGSGAMLPPDPRLDEEATEIRWSFRSDGRICIEPKEDIRKRLGRSPDRFDALANTFYPAAGRNPVDLERLARMIGR
ncbi:MAG: hypothetical protein LUC24_04665 [Bacteroidales bacterium]|nr:hypothetical protein [Bacteroidales bacterium]